ncbi:hypothetical protein NITHO_1750012 [Nitrolancea hollandica Lb]|uniref:Uncharacterized protein n=1 Tax=Nitrolancea hollandica Lb TaxID=1129897 RepID=I4EE85_9BACT|nr:hypothetical protein NITHO_1750012 [Nitrolancea hollandica Lb]
MMPSSGSNTSFSAAITRSSRTRKGVVIFYVLTDPAGPNHEYTPGGMHPRERAGEILSTVPVIDTMPQGPRNVFALAQNGFPRAKPARH